MKIAGRKWVMVLAAALAVVLMASAAWAAPGGVKGKPSKVKMKDIHGHWGEENIARMVAKGFIKGYEDLSFRPGNEVTHQEVIAMLVRAMGLEDEAQARTSVQLNLRHSQQLSPWAAGYLAEAVESGLLLPAEMASIIPNKPAKRGEIAAYLSRILIWAKLNAAAEGTADFADMDEISSELMAYVSPVYTWGLMLGDNQHKFQPNKPVSRAEMAIILERLSDLLQNGQADRERISGTLQAITVGAEASIKVTKLAGGQLEAPVADDAAIYRNNKRVELADLRTGDLVEVILEEDQAVFIAATAPQLVISVTGTVKSVNTGDRTVTATLAGGSETEYHMASSVQIKLNGETVPLSALRQGDTVKIYLREGLAVKIEATRANTTEVAGTITAVSIGSDPQITVKKADNQAVSYAVYAGAEITLDDEEAELQDLRPGYLVELKIRSNQAVQIDARTFLEVEGTLTALTIGSDPQITVKKADNQTVSYVVYAGAEITLDDDEAELQDLRPGYLVEVKIRSNQAVQIDARSFNQVEGTIVSLVIGTPNKVTLKASDNTQTTYTLASGADILVDGATKSFASLTPGWTAKATIEDGLVTKIEADAP